MVEIIEGPPHWQIDRTCRCKAKLRATREDIKIGHFGPNWGGETPEKLPYFECPCCAYNITLKWNEIPADLTKELEDKERQKKSSE